MSTAELALVPSAYVAASLAAPFLSFRIAQPGSLCAPMAAADAALRGDFAYFSGLTDDALRPQLTQKDEDGRSLLHTAAGAGARRCRGQLTP